MLPLVSCQRHTHRYSFELRRGGEKNAIIGLGLHARCPKVIIFSLVFCHFSRHENCHYEKKDTTCLRMWNRNWWRRWSSLMFAVKIQDPYLTATLNERVCAKCKTSKLQTLLCAQISQSWAGLLGRQSSSLFFFRRGFKFFLQQYCGFTPWPNIPMMAGSKMLHHWGKLQFFSNLSKVFLIVHREMCPNLPQTMRIIGAFLTCASTGSFALSASFSASSAFLFAMAARVASTSHVWCSYLNVSAMWNREKAKM